MKILFFYTNWCVPCLEQFELLTKANGEQFTIEKVNLEDNYKSSVEYGVRNIPAIVVLGEYGEVVERVEGIREEFQLKHLIDSLSEDS